MRDICASEEKMVDLQRRVSIETKVKDIDLESMLY